MSYCGEHDEYTNGCSECEWHKELYEQDAKIADLETLLVDARALIERQRGARLKLRGVLQRLYSAGHWEIKKGITADEQYQLWTEAKEVLKETE